MGLEHSDWRGRRVLITGHTGFKGAWLALWLEHLGADVHGFSLPPESADGAFARMRPLPRTSRIGDIRHARELRDAVVDVAPSVVFHLAAEAIVRRAYRSPVATFETNVMGTINVLEAVRACDSVETVLVVTSDKVYEDASERPAREDDPLGSVDPYSSSKACAELVVRAWRSSFLEGRNVSLGTGRAGNVIGGGDTALDRLVPDALRADLANEPVVLRHPRAIRPWQHVLDPLHGYLLFAQHLLRGGFDGPMALNFGPEDVSWTVLDVITYLQRALGGGSIEVGDDTGPHEAPALLLDSELARRTLGWRPLLATEDALDWTAQWHRGNLAGADLTALALEQIAAFEARAGTA